MWEGERTAGTGVVRSAAASRSTRYEVERPEPGRRSGGGAAKRLGRPLQPPAGNAMATVEDGICSKTRREVLELLLVSLVTRRI